ncbi:MAG: hypothetical protein HXS46_12270 [Theionarchaea archaeon]|nr:hypothetical protein [Theionarchaea archaeon]
MGESMGSIKPDYIARAVKNRQGKDKWTDIGVAYTSTKGIITVYLSALPLNDKIVLIPVKKG